MSFHVYGPGYIRSSEPTSQGPNGVGDSTAIESSIIVSSGEGDRSFTDGVCKSAGTMGERNWIQRIDGFLVQMYDVGLLRSKIMYQFCDEKEKLDPLICYWEIIWHCFPQDHLFVLVCRVFGSITNDISKICNGEATIINTETDVSSMNHKCLYIQTKSR